MYYLCLFLALLPLLLLKLKRRDNNGLRLPPRPWRPPVIGSLHHMLGSPLPTMPCLTSRAGSRRPSSTSSSRNEVPVVVTSSPDAAREIMKTHDVNFATRPWSPTVKVLMADGEGLVFVRYGPEWWQLRKISILELLSARRVQSFRGVREEEVGRLVAAIAGSPPAQAMNLSQRIAVLINDMAVRSMHGRRPVREAGGIFGACCGGNRDHRRVQPR
jgi:cytochrome P450